jgi:alpha-galactosidase
MKIILSYLIVVWTVAVFLSSAFNASAGEAFWVSSLNLGNMEESWGQPGVDKSVIGGPLTIGGKTFAHGVGTHAISVLRIRLDGQGEEFTAQVGLDDEIGQCPASLVFQVEGDSKILFDSGMMRTGEAAKPVAVNLAGVKVLTLLVNATGNDISCNHADWAEARITMREGKPITTMYPSEPLVVLTPQPPPSPRINGPKIFGIRPKSPFLFTIPATGERPMTFAVENLPAGLEVDPQNGHITGWLTNRGEYVVTLVAKNALGTDRRAFKIVCGDTIALTPPMGWNSWNCFGCDVTDAKVRAAADAMVSSGLINHGWTYINIDDCWEGGRDTNGNIIPNAKFPDMKALADYLHSQGLKIGIYSSPGPKTCGGNEGSYGHEQQDARQFAKWGFDYLKYDWCSYGNIAPNPTLEQMKKPYEVMHDALAGQPRDLVFSFCQYGMGDVWKWGASVGGNSWRTGGDIVDTWTSVSGIGFGQAGREQYAGSGHWNDPDMLVVGQVGWSANLRPTRLTVNEQFTHISLWALLNSPLLIGCDMTKLDDFTLGLLSNDEVLAINQDSLGRQAARVSADGVLEVWAKDMADGSKVAGLFNCGENDATVTLNWYDLGLTGKQSVRDLWRQKDLGIFNGQFQVRMGRHGVALVKLTPAK